MLFLACSIFLFAFANGDIWSGITKCKLPDDDCLKKATQDLIPVFIGGLPEYNVETMDPYKMDMLDLSSRTLKFVLTDLIAYGVKKCTVTKMSINGLNMSAAVQCALEVYGKYEMSGQILVINIQGKGDTHLTLPGLEVSADVLLAEHAGKDGKKHWKVKTFTHNYNLYKDPVIRMSNLFNGNKALSQAMNYLLDSSSREVINEFMPTILQQLIGIFAKNVNNFFKANAIEDITLQ